MFGFWKGVVVISSVNYALQLRQSVSSELDRIVLHTCSNRIARLINAGDRMCVPNTEWCGIKAGTFVHFFSRHKKQETHTPNFIISQNFNGNQFNKFQPINVFVAFASAVTKQHEHPCLCAGMDRRRQVCWKGQSNVFHENESKLSLNLRTTTRSFDFADIARMETGGKMTANR